MESNRLPRPSRALLTTLGVLGALAVVAVASRGSTAVGEEGSRRPGDTLLDIFLAVYLLMLALGAAFFVYLLALQRHARRKSGQEPTGKLSLILMFALLLAGALAARQLSGLRLRPPPDEVIVPGGGDVPTTTAPLPPEETAYDPGFAWIPVLVFVGLLVLAAAAILLGGRRRRRSWAGEEAPGLGVALADVLDETLDALRAERDPRRAVIAAYARLERVLAAHGLARRASEAPFEYLGRVLADLSVSPSAVRRLTLLFEWAKFSQHEVDETMKDEAIDALQTVQDELRAAEAEAQLERQRALQQQAGRAGATG